jgi:hypothetical protein
MKRDPLSGKNAIDEFHTRGEFACGFEKHMLDATVDFSLKRQRKR